MATINPSQDYDIIHTLTYASSGGTGRIELYRGSGATITGTVYYRAGTSGAWTSLSVSGISTTFPITSTTMQIAHDWNKSGDDYMTPSFKSGTMTGIAISQKAAISGVVGAYFMNGYARDSYSLTTLEVPDISGVTSAGTYFMSYYAYNCSSLTTLDVPDTSSMTSVGPAFMDYHASGCTSLTSLAAPDTSSMTSAGVNFMQAYARDSYSLTTLATPDTSGMTSVGHRFMRYYASGCTSLTTLVIPDTSGLTSVGDSFMNDYAYNCSSLTQLTLPKAGWFKTNNVDWGVPSGRLGLLRGDTTNSIDHADWQALTVSGKTLYTNYIRNSSGVWLNGVSPSTEVAKTQLGTARVAKTIAQAQQSSGRISKTINSLQTAISYIVLLFTNSQDSVARVQKALTSVQGAVSSVRARTVFSRGSYESLPVDDSDLTIPYSSTEVSNVSAGDGAYTNQGGSGFVLHEYKVYHNLNTATITVKWVGKSTVPCNEEPVHLQIYNYDTGVWVTLDSDGTSSAGMNFELIGTPSGNNGDYYDPDGFIAVRVYQ